MNKLKTRMLAVALVVTCILSSFSQGSVALAGTAAPAPGFDRSAAASEAEPTGESTGGSTIGSTRYETAEAQEENSRQDTEMTAAGPQSAESASTGETAVDKQSAEPASTGETNAGEQSAESAATRETDIEITDVESADSGTTAAEKSFAGETTAETQSAETKSAETKSTDPQSAEPGSTGKTTTENPTGQNTESGNARRETKAEMPEFNDEKTVGKYIVKIHAAEGVLPKGAKVTVRIMNAQEAQPYAEKVEKMADVGEVTAVFDITFTDEKGKEIQPGGAVEVSFDNAAEEDAAMSVYHAVDDSVDKIVTVPSNIENSCVQFESYSFSPFILLAAADEPDWTKGGGGIRDVSADIKVQHNNTYVYQYEDYGFWGNEDYAGCTMCLGMYVDGELAGWSYCVDPLKNGYDMDGVWAGKVSEISAPMFVKALYYGASGENTSVIKYATGYSDYGALNIITHVAASEIYARLNYASQSDAGDGFLAANSALKNAVYKYVKEIEDLPVPSGYYGYVTGENGYANDGGRHQNFAFGSFALIDGKVTLKKESQSSALTDKNSCYTFNKAKYWVYTSKETALKRGDEGWVSGGSIITDADGNAEPFRLKKGDYFLIEGVAPDGYLRSDKVYPITIKAGKEESVTVKDEPAKLPCKLYIDKKCKNGDGKNYSSLAGAEFTVNYYNGYYAASKIPQKATKTWVIKTIKTSDGAFRASLDSTHLVKGDSFYKDGNDIVLPLGTITIEETKAPLGYKNDGSFGGNSKYVGQIQLNEGKTAAILVDLQGKRTTTNSFEVSDTPLPPQIGTNAVDHTSNTRVACADGKVTIEDTVSYKNFVVGKTYTLKGKLVDQKTGETIKDLSGKEVTAESTLSTTAMDGTAKMQFTFEADSTMAGRSAVVFETVTYEGKEYASHADLNAEAQTIHFPRIGTSAVSADTEDHIMKPSKDAQIIDTVAYENLIPGQEYTVKGAIMVKSTGKALSVNGEEITAETKFTPGEADGETKVSFSFDATGVKNEDLVVFEELYLGTNKIAAHKDLGDEGQTIHIPQVRTDACDEDTGKKNTLAAKDRVIADKVTYKNLIPGKTYEIRGEIKIKSEEAANFDDAETVPSEIVGAEGEGTLSFDTDKVTFVPAGNEGETVSGQILVSFKIDASELAGEEIVVGETISYKGVEIAIHHNLDDKRQNDFIPYGQTEAVDTATGIKSALAAENRVIRDSFYYENLLPGETYRFTGKVMAGKEVDEEGNQVLEEIPCVMTDENGVPVENGCIEFTPSEKDGMLDLYFSIDATELENRDVTVFELVTLDGNSVIIHEVLDGTQTLYVPEGGTEAVDMESQDRIAMADDQVTVIDTFVYKNLIPGIKYTVKGRVMRKSDTSEIPSELTEAAFKDETAGKEISVEDGTASFVPETEDGALALTFVFDGSQLRGDEVVLFERMYHNDSEVIIHENIDDESQTVHFPDGHTTAADPDTEDRTMKAGSEVIIRDRFFYENLLPGAEYVISGKVMLKPVDGKEAQELVAKMTDADGNEVEEWKFKPEEEEGCEELYFAINSDELAGRSAVVFETLEFINPDLETRATVIVHEDIEDEEQTIHFPDGRTRALDSDTTSHTAYADENVTILDEVEYMNLIPGKLYTITGTIMDKDSGMPLIAGGDVVTASKEFVPKSPDGSVIVEFTFSGVDLAGRSVVAFETVSSGGKEVFVHADLTDEEQSINFPQVKTSAVDEKDGDREISYKGSVQIVDTVTYKNLTPGNKYRVSGVLMNKSSGQPAKSGGKEITGEAVFKAKEKDGTIKIPFKFNSSDLKEGEYVVFETLYEINAKTGEEKAVAAHKDLTDKSQTVKRPATPKSPGTGDEAGLWEWISVFTAAAIGVIAVVIFGRRKM